ncbi:hypothetical protein NZK32_13635 [Cyanobium sp. FGCU-52]|nr:hypothetical protein [Cyanobium sp. FGCU52]
MTWPCSLNGPSGASQFLGQLNFCTQLANWVSRSVAFGRGDIKQPRHTLDDVDSLAQLDLNCIGRVIDKSPLDRFLALPKEAAGVLGHRCSEQESKQQHQGQTLLLTDRVGAKPL